MSPLSLLAALALAGAPPMAERPAFPAPPERGERIELTVRFAPWQYTGTFELRVGGLTDRGAARDGGSLVGPQRVVERVLTGERGSLVVELAGVYKGLPYPPLYGRWRVVRGTGAFAGLTGGGSFGSVDAGAGKVGSAFELQVLLGRVTRP